VRAAPQGQRDDADQRRRVHDAARRQNAGRTARVDQAALDRPGQPGGDRGGADHGAGQRERAGVLTNDEDDPDARRTLRDLRDEPGHGLPPHRSDAQQRAVAMRPRQVAM
jgi:hypothetical protein